MQRGENHLLRDVEQIKTDSPYSVLSGGRPNTASGHPPHAYTNVWLGNFTALSFIYQPLPYVKDHYM